MATTERAPFDGQQYLQEVIERADQIAPLIQVAKEAQAAYREFGEDPVKVHALDFAAKSEQFDEYLDWLNDNRLHGRQALARTQALVFNALSVFLEPTDYMAAHNRQPVTITSLTDEPLVLRKADFGRPLPPVHEIHTSLNPDYATIMEVPGFPEYEGLNPLDQIREINVRGHLGFAAFMAGGATVTALSPDHEPLISIEARED